MITDPNAYLTEFEYDYNSKELHYSSDFPMDLLMSFQPEVLVLFTEINVRGEHLSPIKAIIKHKKIQKSFLTFTSKFLT